MRDSGSPQPDFIHSGEASVFCPERAIAVAMRLIVPFADAPWHAAIRDGMWFSGIGKYQSANSAGLKRRYV
ncbi:hypothetical protein [Cupriavidus consociatus]|uniref:hypothetical protein n=1 Tax=Cupriavidus consociatus TaxID=2821357 RepID=UPI001AE48960|nr:MULTISPECIES: hypothetical protein [unclassified Cupriavidus]MBP0620072.1 hypothetical protein [Cupriavidus sp. LEh25]MDK2656727.1 hypothetical protein [Cupriavidus sp. LEh21]